MEVEIYTDESYFQDKKTKKVYIGIGCLFVPTNFKEKMSKDLSNLRCLNGSCSQWSWKIGKCNINDNICKEKWHNYNNCEIHYKKLSNSSSQASKKISKRWIEYLVNYNRKNLDTENLIYFKILYLDCSKLDMSEFGDEKTQNIIYNRFYRSMILGVRKYFFTGQYFSIKEFFHDKSDDKESDNIFPWHAPSKLEEMKDFNIQKEEISFIDSNHKEYSENQDKINSQFIQFIDLILGCSNQILFRLSNDKMKKELANDYYPLFKRLWEHPKNPNSSYNYYRKQDISIFPKDKIRDQEDLYHELTRLEGQYHRNIKIREIRQENESGPLDRYFS